MITWNVNCYFREDILLTFFVVLYDYGMTTTIDMSLVTHFTACKPFKDSFHVFSFKHCKICKREVVDNSFHVLESFSRLERIGLTYVDPSVIHYHSCEV